MRRLSVLATTCVLLACGGDEMLAPVPTEPPLPDPVEPARYELASDAYTVLQQVWEPLVPSADTRAAIDSEELLVTDLDRFAEFGLGVQRADGLPWVEHLELAPGFQEGTQRKSLAYLWQAADPQIIDEESPIRLEGFPALYRPAGHLTAQVFEAHVRSAQRLSDLSGRGFDFVLLAGDLTDGTHLNELSWMLTALNGGIIDPDSGRDDDPVLGPGNDFNDPFISDGIDAPWYAAIGNHETMYNGGFGALSDELRAMAVGTEIGGSRIFRNGYRDGNTPNAEVVTEGSTSADERRKLLDLHDVLAELEAAEGEPAGHGLDADAVSVNRGYFSLQPIAGKPIRLITLNTVYPEPPSIGVGAQGYVDEEQLSWLEAELQAADASAELVIVMSHHRLEDLSPDSPATGEDVAELLEASDGVVVHVVGHGHRNEKAFRPATTTGVYGYWELMLASTVDFPMQSRIIEIVDESNGYVSIYATNLGHNSTEDSLAQRGRELGAVKRSFPSTDGPADVAAFWAGDVTSQNLLLRVQISDALRDSLALHSWPDRIESLETLAALSLP
jgi:3',5'-cyclic AMP phosphodiesterase CpdA